jgi:hypothetical protein
MGSRQRWRAVKIWIIAGLFLCTIGNVWFHWPLDGENGTLPSNWVQIEHVRMARADVLGHSVQAKEGEVQASAAAAATPAVAGLVVKMRPAAAEAQRQDESVSLAQHVDSLNSRIRTLEEQLNKSATVRGQLALPNTLSRVEDGEHEVMGVPENAKLLGTGTVNWGLVTTMPCRKVGQAQLAAFQSWERLKPKPKIFVLSDCEPPELKGKATIITRFDSSFDGLPLFSGMMHITTRVAATEGLNVCAWVNADILLAPNVGRTIQAAFKQHKFPWLLLGLRHNIPATDLYDPEKPPPVLETFIVERGTLHETGGVDLFVWNQPQRAIIRAPFPPFIRTANVWDNWWVTEAGATRTVVDASIHMTVGHIEHDRFDSTGGKVERELHKRTKALLSPWTASSHSDWHNYHNRAVLLQYQRGYTRGIGTPNALEIETAFMANGRLSFRVPAKRGKLKLVGERIVTLYQDKRMSMFPAAPSLMKEKDKGFGSPHNLSSLLPLMDPSKPVILTGATSGFIPFMMSWVCNLKRLDMFENVLIAAFDEEAYAQLYLLGMPVFIPSNSIKGAPKGGPGHYRYGEQTYIDVTKMKTAVVYDVLNRGYDVLWCDPDIAVYKPFVKYLTSKGLDFQLQNNNPTSLQGENELKTNSGFYLAKAVPWVIEALGKVIDHAKQSKHSEQMSWNAVLCKEQRFKDNYCLYKNNQIHFLSREEFATGSETDSVSKRIEVNQPPEELYVWHNNWIAGYKAKYERMQRVKQIWWDERWEVCSSEQDRHLIERYFRRRQLPAVTTAWDIGWPRFAGGVAVV